MGGTKSRYIIWHNHNGQRPNGAMRLWWSLVPFVSAWVRIYCPHYKTFPTGLSFDPLDSPAAHVSRGAPHVPETQIPQRGWRTRNPPQRIDHTAFILLKQRDVRRDYSKSVFCGITSNCNIRIDSIITVVHICGQISCTWKIFSRCSTQKEWFCWGI